MNTNPTKKVIQCDDDCTIEVQGMKGAILLSVVDSESCTTRLTYNQVEKLISSLQVALTESIASFRDTDTKKSAIHCDDFWQTS